jgi:UDP-N-acetyl-D-glucosamine dehydrogenase
VLMEIFKNSDKKFGVIGLGYVGLNLAVTAAESGFTVMGFDVDAELCARINSGKSHITDISNDRLGVLVSNKLIYSTNEFTKLLDCFAIVICVPTPLNKLKEPDLSHVISATKEISKRLCEGQIIILESTTYPGTTRDLVLPILEGSDKKVGNDFYLCFSPERIDPGNKQWNLKNTPKLLAGVTNDCKNMGLALYKMIFDRIVVVETVETAELVKVYENTFRMINIALANELSMICDKLGLNVWEVINAAATKPFGFMKFKPGPGVGGHCIPLDPHYLSWRMRNFFFKTKMIELASEINSGMPEYTVNKLAAMLNDKGLPLRGAKIMIVGITYKRNIEDLKESPALEVIKILLEKGSEVSFHDPYCQVIPTFFNLNVTKSPMYSIDLTEEAIIGFDVVVIITDHESIDFQWVASKAKSILDTRGVI